ncbi:DUF7446 family protein [Undibacterium sp. SXout7W]|uniref:DUF7446 family protein n=1 Tax=Undibacterium sp. SXout7W TaxID=3413049 RepID=UPI003BF3B8B1
MSKIHVSTSPLTNRIYAGRVNKAGTAYLSKDDVTSATCGAVIEHVIANGEPVTVTLNGVPKYRIIVEILGTPAPLVEGGAA